MISIQKTQFFFISFIFIFLLGNISFAQVASVDVSKLTVEERYPVAVQPKKSYNSLVLQRLRQSDNVFGENFTTIGEVTTIPTPTPTPTPKFQYANYSTITDSAELVRVNKIICDRVPYSPLCNNPYLQDRLRKISDERSVDFWLMVGITLAESRIGTDFAGGCDASYYNWGGVKARRLDSGEIIRDYPIPDNNGCWLYKFDSVEDYWISTSNIINLGYLQRGCSEEEDVARCISRCYVGGCGSGEEEHWIEAVNYFAPPWKRNRIYR